jgi:hypothetical protein
MDSNKSGDRLHTELSLVDAAAFSVGLIGPVGAIGLLGTTPYIEVAYLIVGLVVVCVVPRLAGRVRAGLAAGSVP